MDGNWIKTILLFLCGLTSGVGGSFSFAEAPSASYIFPAGGQRGTSVNVRVGGHYLYDRAAWEMRGVGITASPEITHTQRIWFEGPLVKLPASQQKEDYPQDYLGNVQIAADAPLGPRLWRTWNAQGVAPTMKFIVGRLPEVIEQEADGEPIVTAVSLPVTINGRIFPREDVDAWSFEAKAGQSITCSVAAEQLGSALEAVIEVRDPAGKVVANSSGDTQAEPQLRFTAATAGTYQVRIWDSRYSGLQNYVYRLTVTADAWVDAIYPLGGRRGEEAEVEAVGQGIANNRLKLRWPDRVGLVRHDFGSLNPLVCDVDELPEVLEPAAGNLPTLPFPGIANGRIDTPGDVDAWPFVASKGQPLVFEIRAARLGSPLDAVLEIKDAAGKMVARAEGGIDSSLHFTPSEDGQYIAEISDRFASRGGARFAYRLRATQPTPDFRLKLFSDALAVNVGSEQKLKVDIDRRGGFTAPIRLSLSGLPAGVTCAEVEVPGNQNSGELIVRVAKESPVQIAWLQVIGKAVIGEATIQRMATYPASLGEADVTEVFFIATLTTPFKFKGQYEFRYVARGGTLKKSYEIERGDYAGPLDVSLADRQGRHLQGIAGPTLTVPAGATQFEYEVSLPPWMELGRTSRTNLMLVGEVADSAGKKHKVSYSTVDQNEQLIALVSPAPLRLTLAKPAVLAKANSELVVPVKLHRQTGLSAPCRLELVVPPHMQAITSELVTAEGTTDSVELRIKLGDKPGPFNMPLIIRGTSQHAGGPIVAEVPLELLLK